MIMESKQSIKLFSQQLKSKLQQGMRTGGPKQAIQICNIVAEDIARQVSEQYGWKIARTSLKVRNSNNAPDEWEAKVLRYFEQRKKNGDAIEELDYSEIIDSANAKVFRYTSRGYACGFYSEVFLVESKALKQAHSKLCNCFSNAAIGQKQSIENRNRGRAEYI